MWINAFYLVMSRIDLILLGSLKGSNEAGVYAIAARAAEFASFTMIAMNAGIGPEVSQFYHSGEHEKLQRLATVSARRLALASIPVVIILVGFAHPLITFFYGNSYGEGATALQVLVTAQFLNIVSGPLGILLNMTKYAGTLERTFAAGAVLNILLNFLMIRVSAIRAQRQQQRLAWCSATACVGTLYDAI